MKKENKKIEKELTDLGMSGVAYKVLIEPIITEAASLASESGKYIFRVSGKATKAEIKKSIEQLYRVHVVKVNTANKKRKAVNYGKTPGFKAGSKKAIVTLKKGDSIELFKGL